MGLDNSPNRISCHNCKIVIRPPYTACRCSHPVCSSCNSCIDTKNQKVIECNAKRKELPFFNVLFADVFDNCQFDCGYRGKLLTLNEHESSCTNKLRRKPVQCFMISCKWRDAVHNMADHFSKNHPNNFITLTNPEEEFSIIFKNQIMLIRQFGADSPFNELYLLNLLRSGTSCKIGIQYIGHTGPEIEVDQTMDEFTISESACKMKDVKVGNISRQEDIYSFTENLKNPTDPKEIITFKSNKYLVSLKKRNSQKLSENIIKLSECAICYDIILGKIPMCVDGHSICEECAKKVESWPMCRDKLSDRGNHFVEQLLGKFDFDCKFKSAGCPVRGSSKEIKIHSLNCVYRTTECVLAECKWTGLNKDLVKHTKVNHRAKIMHLRMKYAYRFLENHLYSAFLISAYDQCFNFVVASDGDHFHLSVFHITDEKSDFDFTMSWYNEKTRCSLMISRPCPSGKIEDVKIKSFVFENSFMVSKKFLTNSFRGSINIYRNTSE